LRSSCLIVILSRTAMADVPQAAAAVAAWWACRRGRAFAIVAWLTILMALKSTGSVLALAIVAGEGVSSWSALRAGDTCAWRRLGAGILGGGLGFALGLAQNRVANGTFSSGYDAVFERITPFALSYLPARLPTYLTTLLLEPPLLVVGAWTFWRRRDFGPLFVVGGFLAMMCFYFFSDTGASRLESFVLSPRLILPVIAFLLVGYSSWLDELATRVRGAVAASDARSVTTPPSMPQPATPAWLAAALVVIPLVSAAAVSLRHWRNQRAMGFVLEVASAVADAQGDRTLGVTSNASKAGVLHDGPTTLFDPASTRTATVFCSERSASHRESGPSYSCIFPGYHTVTAREGFYALARDDAGGGAR
jgi:hypothetical protein